MVGTPPTVAAGQTLATKPTDIGKIPTPESTPNIYIDLNNDTYNTSLTEQTITNTTHHITARHELTMSTPEQPSTSGSNRHRTQRFKRWGHQTQLGNQARANISQLLHRKSQTHAPSDTDERFLAIGRFYDAPLNAIMLSPHIYPWGNKTMTDYTYTIPLDASTSRSLLRSV
jgi:hypothetical protein